MLVAGAAMFVEQWNQASQQESFGHYSESKPLEGYPSILFLDLYLAVEDEALQ